MGITLHRTGTMTVEFAQPQEIVLDQANDSVRIGDGTNLVTTTDAGGGKRAMDVNVTSSNMTVAISHTEDSIQLGDGTDLMAVNTDGSINTQNAYVSTNNSSTATLANGATYTGTWEDTTGFNTITVAVKTDQAGTLYVDYSPDASNADSTLTYTVTAAVNEVHRLTNTRRYFRVRFTNSGGSSQTYFRLQSQVGNHQLLTSGLNSTLQSDADAIVSRAVLVGQTDGGVYTNVPVTPEGHIEVAVHGPRLPFGSIHTESLTPVFQTDAVYGLNSSQVTSGAFGTGASATASNSMFVCQSGTSAGGSSFIQSRKRLRYRAGQGIVGRFTAMYTTGVANSYQVAGFGHAEDGVYVGYKGTDFGILYNHHGTREIQTLTVTNAATGAGNTTVTLNGVGYTVAMSASAVGSIPRTVYELSQATYLGWKAQPNGAGTQVIFVADSVGDQTGSFTISGSGVTGSFAETLAGAAVTEVFIPQNTFNGDVLDGTGSSSNKSGMLLDPTKLNVFQIGIQYLGAGAITVEIENAAADGNNAEFVVIHTIRLPNTLTQTSFKNPSFPFTMSAYSTTSTTNLTVKVGSFAGFIEGMKRLHGPRFSYYNQSASVTAAGYTPLFTLMNSRVHVSKANQSVVNVLSCNAAVKHNNPVVFYLIKNGALTGPTSFSDYASNVSCTLYDQSSTGVTFSTQDQLIWSGHLGETGQTDHAFAEGGPEEITLQPGEYLTLAVKTVFGNATYATGAINTREDQ